MTNEKKTIFGFSNDLLFYFVLSISYTAFLFAIYLLNHFKIWNFSDNIFLYSFNASLSELKQWFPKFGFYLYSIIFLFKYSPLLLIPYFIYKVRSIDDAQFKNSVNIDFHFKKFILRQLKINLLFLCFYIFLYFIFIFFGDSYFQNFQILITKGYLIQLIAQVIFNSIRFYSKLIVYLKSFFLSPHLPFNISILRIIFFSCLIFIYIIIYMNMASIVSLKAKVTLPFIGWLIDIIPINVEVYTSFFYLGVLSCIFIVVGFKTRFFLLLNAICVFYLMATPNFFGKLWHLQLMIWISWFFAFSRCYDVFSIDSKLNNTTLVKSANYTFPIRFVWLQLGIIYLWSGFHKLWDSGFDWALSQSMVNQVQLEWVQHYDKIPEIRIDHYPLLLHACGLGVILFELSYFFFVLKPKYLWVSALGGLLMHNLIGYFMYISFVFLQIIYIFFFDFNLFFNKIKVNIDDKYSKIALYSGLVILSFNFCFGIFNINSYPFSSYPSYSAIIPNRVKIIVFECKRLNSTVQEIGKANNFRWEDYGGLENNLIADFESGQNVQKRLEDYWLIWLKPNPQLQVCDTVLANLIERPVSPEGMKKIVFIKKIGIIHIKK